MRSTRILVTIYFFFCSGTVLYAQVGNGNVITGTVKSEEGAKVIPQASVSLRKFHDSLLIKGTYSDTSGNFILRDIPDGQYLLSVTCVGYRAFSTGPVAVHGQGQTLDSFFISLKPDRNGSLQTVVVTGQKAYIEEKPGITTVNVGAAISNAGTNALEVLKSAPGVTIDEEGGLSLRGRESVVVYLDDKPTYISGKDLANYLKSLPSGTLDKIEVMTNPPARYNSGGSAGIINIRTKKNQLKGFNVNFAAGYTQGFYPKFNASTGFNYRKEKINVYGSLAYSYAKNFSESDRSRTYYNDKGGLQNMFLQDFAKAGYQQSTNYKLGLDYYQSKNTDLGLLVSGFFDPYRDNTLYHDRFIDSAGIQDSAINVNSRIRQRWDNLGLGFNLRHRFTQAKQLTANIDYVNYEDRQQQVSASDTYPSSGGNTSLLTTNQPFSIHIYSAKADYAYEPKNGPKLEAGIQALYSKRDSKGEYFNTINNITEEDTGLTNQFIYKENINSGYIAVSKAYGKLSVDAGLRVENTHATGHQYLNSDSSFRLNYTNLLPSVNILYKFGQTAQNQLSFSYGRRLTRPDYEALNPSIYFVDQYTYYTGNPLLKPEYADNLEASLGIGKRASFTLSYSTVRDDIMQLFEQIGQSFVVDYQNLRRVINMGISTRLSIPVTSWWNFNINGDLMNRSFQGSLSNGQQLNSNGSYLRFSGSNSIRFDSEWSAEIGGLYKSKSLYGQAEIGGFGQVNTSVQKRIFNGNGTLNLTARDIFHTYKINREIAIPAAQVYYKNIYDTQIITLSITYKFGRLKAGATSHSSGVEKEQERAGNPRSN